MLPLVCPFLNYVIFFCLQPCPYCWPWQQSVCMLKNLVPEPFTRVTHSQESGTSFRNLHQMELQPPPKTPIAIISGMGKATNFKFGWNIHRVHPNISPLYILEKRERGRIHGLPNFWGYPLLSQQLVKLRTSDFVCTFIGSIGTKAH